MRVLITTVDFGIGGFTSHTCNLGTALRRMGHHVSALVFEPFGPCWSDMQQSLDRVLVLRRGLETRRGFLRRVISAVETLAPDVWINNAVPFSQAALPFLADDIVRISVVHTDQERQVPFTLAGREYLDWIVAVADNSAETVRRLAPDWKRLRVIPVGVQVNERPGPRRDIGPKVRLVYLGRLEAQKNLPALVAVLDHLHSSGVAFALTVIGDGHEKAWLAGQLEQRPYKSGVLLRGELPHSEALSELSKQDILLQTSDYESTPHVLLEAMAAGVSVVCSNLHGGTDRIIENGVNGFLCDPAVPETYGRVVRELMQAPARWRSICGNAYETILTRYSLDVIATQYSQCMFDPARRPFSGTEAMHPSGLCVSAALRPYCTGILRQCKHRLGDILRRRGRVTMPCTTKANFGTM